MNYFDDRKKSLCCGCTACEHSCNNNIIRMKEDEKGFLYPEIDGEKCINCGLCVKVCPLAENHSEILSHESKEKCHAFVIKDATVLDYSTSGGAFSAIARAFCTGDYKVYGVVYDKDMKLKYASIEDIREIRNFSKSKYFQTELNNTLESIYKDLEKGIKVLFSGTPCHVAGLKSFLGKDYENLLCLDLMCYGVSSKNAFLSYKKYLEEKYDDKLIDFKFRDHSNKILMTFKNKGIISIPAVQSLYMEAYYSRLMHRECCLECQFTHTARQGDITIGDFWGIENFSNNFLYEKGISLIIFNSIKAARIREKVLSQGKHEEFELENIKKYNQFSRNTFKVCNNFYKDLNSGISFGKTVKRNSPKYFKTRIRNIAEKYIPEKIKSIIKNF